MWTGHGVSLFCAVTVSDKAFDAVMSNFSTWKGKQPYFKTGAELKGTHLSALQQASFVNSVVLSTTGLRLSLAGTKTTLFKKEIAQQFIRDAANILRATARSGDETDRPLVADFFRRMAGWMGDRSPENLMWIYCLGDAIHLSMQHGIAFFAEPADDGEFENIDILIDQSFIGKPTDIQFWQEWLRNFIYSRSVKDPIMVPMQWTPRDHPFNRKYGRARGLADMSDLFRSHVYFVESNDALGVQIADVCANICYRFYSINPKYRPYRLLRSRISGKYKTEIHYAVLNESSLLKDAPENHVKDYSEEERSAMAEIEATRLSSEALPED